jgi:hypothetical protein
MNDFLSPEISSKGIEPDCREKSRTLKVQSSRKAGRALRHVLWS